jgi:hypothetical protein
MVELRDSGIDRRREGLIEGSTYLYHIYLEQIINKIKTINYIRRSSPEIFHIRYQYQNDLNNFNSCYQEFATALEIDH